MSGLFNKDTMLLYFALLAFGLSLSITPMLSRFLTTWNLTDRPDGHRKLHSRAVPRLGGVAIVVALLCSVIAGTLVSRLLSARLEIDFLIKLAPALIVIFVLGLIDDILTLPARSKLCIQVCAALIAVMEGIRFGANAPSSLLLTSLQVLLTVFWLVLCSNAFNLIDGMDGLATGLGLILAITVAFGGWHSHHYQLLFVACLFVGSLLGFLRHNFHPATIFLGDSGSLTIGFLLSGLCVLWSNDQVTPTGRIAPVIAFAVPLADVLCSIARRFLAGRHIFSADCDHIHHRLLRSGRTPRQATLIFYAAAAYASATALTCTLLPTDMGVATLVVFIVVTFWCFRWLNYPEFAALGMAARTFSLTRIVTPNIILNRFRNTIRLSDDQLQFWIAVRQACFDFGFDHVRLTYGDYVYEDNRLVSAKTGRTSLFFSLSENHSLALGGQFSYKAHSAAFGAFLQAIQDELKCRTNSPSQVEVVRTDLTLTQTASVAAK